MKNNCRSILLITAFFLLLAGLCTDAHAGFTNWSSVSVPTGGTVSALAVNPTNRKEILAGGVSTIFKSYTSAHQWQRVKLSNLNVNAIAYHPTDGSLVYAGLSGGTGGIYKSTDGGTSWGHLDGPGYILSLAIDPKTPTTIYAGGASATGIYKSTNSGTNWTFFPVAVLAGRDINVIAVDKNSPSVLYIGTFGQGILRSQDGGTTWTAINVSVNIGTSLSTYSVTGIAILPPSVALSTSSNLVVSVGSSGSPGFALYKTTDASQNGATWAGKGPANTFINYRNVLVQDPANGSKLYVCLSSNPLQKSSDGGATWLPVASGPPSDFCNSLAIDPINSNTIYVGRYDGVWKTTDGFVSTGSLFNVGLDNGDFTSLSADTVSSTTIYAGLLARVLKSTNAGSSWTLSDLPATLRTYFVVADPINNNNVYVSSEWGLYNSSSGLPALSSGWAPWNTPLASNPYFTGLAIGQNPMNDTYGALYGLGVYKNNGSVSPAWGAVSGNASITNTSFSDIVIDPTTTGAAAKVYVGTKGGGVFQTSDAGANWLNSLATETVNALAISKAAPNILVAGALTGVKTSSDSAATWTPVTLGGGDFVTSVATHPTNSAIAVAGTTSSGVFYTSDTGVTWNPISTGLPQDSGGGYPSISKIIIDGTTPGNIYIATDGAGMFKKSFAPVLSVSPAIYDFGTQLVGSVTTQTVTLTNTGNFPLTVSSILVMAGTFSYTPGSSNCSADLGTAFSLPPGQNCNFGLSFTPSFATTVASATDIITFNSDAPVAPTVAISGVATGTAPTIKWAAAVSGNWSDATKWDLGRAPIASDTVAITASGTYTVTLDTTPVTVNGLILGGTSGVQTLSATSKTLTINNPSSIGVNGKISLTGSTINGTGTLTNKGTITLSGSTLGTPVTNAGTILVTSSNTYSYINGTLTTQTGSMLRVDAAGNFSTLTVANGFTNNGTIELTDSIVGGYTAYLNITSGILTNSAATGVINSLPGIGGGRYLTGQLDNQGALSISAPTYINGTSLTNSGTITISPGKTLTVYGGTFTNTLANGITGTGTLILTGESLTAATLTTLSKLTNSTVTLLDSYTMSTALSLTGTTISGAAGSITVPTGQTLTLSGSTLGTPVINAGTILVTGSVGSSSINGTLTTQAGSMLRIDATVYYDAILVVASGFTNNGTIELTSNGGWHAYLNITSGILTNSTTSGVITTLAGYISQCHLTGQLDNQGALSISAPTSINGTSLTNSGTITINPGNTLTVSGGTFTNNQAIGITGTGMLKLTSESLTATTLTTLPKLTNSTVTLLDSYTMSTALSLVSTTISGSAVSITVPSGQTLTLSNSTLDTPVTNAGTIIVTGSASSSAINGTLTTQAGSMLRIDATVNHSALTVASGFTNNGTIELMTTSSVFGYNASLNITSGTLINSAATGVINSLPGIGSGSRYLTGTLDNQGTVLISAPTTISGGTFTNSSIGTLSGAETLNVSGATFNNSGALTPATAGTAGKFSITGTLPDTSSSVTNIDIGGTTAITQYDQIAVSGAATIAGTLNVNLISSFVPTIGDSFTIMTCGSGCDSGIFTTNLPSLSSDKTWSMTYNPASVVLSVIGISVTVNPATPVITWPIPADITFGTALSATQLNATSGGVAGTYIYTPASGTLLNAGAGQTLSVTFTPTDTVNFNTAKSTVNLTVNPATPTASITNSPANYSNSAQTAVVACFGGGTAVLASGGTGTNAGSYPATVDCAVSANYAAATGLNAGKFVINPAIPVITWANPTAITYGIALSATELNATANVPGTIAYTPAIGTVLTAGIQTLFATFTPNDITNYTTQTATVSLTVTAPPANQIITGTDGRTIAPVAVTVGGTNLTISAGTLLTDASGNPITGTLTVTASVMNSTSALPTGLATASTTGGLILSALGNAIDITISAGASQVKTISPPMIVNLPVPSTFALPGATVSYYSYNGATWTLEGTAIVKSDGTVDILVGHLSVWAVAAFTAVVDTIAPVITAVDVPPTSSTLTIPVTAVNATDNVAITGYLLTETAITPSATDPGWQPTVPQTYNCKTWGNNVIYTFAKDSANNISTPTNKVVFVGYDPATDGVIIPAAATNPVKLVPSIEDAKRSLDFAMKVKLPTTTELQHGRVAPLVNGIPKPDQNRTELNLGDTIVILRRVVGL